MRTAIRLVGFALGLATVFGAAYGTGRLVGAVPGLTEPAHRTVHPEPTGQPAGTAPAGGLLVSDRGYTLDPVPAAAGEFAFRVLGPDGRPVLGYDVTHDARMHLIVVRRDLTGYRHVHPAMDGDGTWRTTTPMTEPGSWRAFADFTPTGREPLTLGVDVDVPGHYRPRPLPPPASTAVVDGYTVRLDGGLEPGRTSTVTMTVSRDGQPVTELEPYLGAYGHLVALRDGDLAYLHVHPEDVPGDGRTAPKAAVTFSVEVPSAGTYRLYLDFRHAGAVRTAEFTVSAAPAPTGGTAPGHGHD